MNLINFLTSLVIMLLLRRLKNPVNILLENNSDKQLLQSHIKQKRKKTEALKRILSQ